MPGLAFADAITLAGKIRAKEVGAVELLELYLDRVERYNPALNAIVHLEPERARERAAAADAALARGESWGPLHGVPITVKESVDWAGTPSTRGVTAWRDNVATEDATALARLVAAGAVPFGKTNVPFMLADWQSFNDVYGTTNNPWDPTRVPGGSSGGSAAALAAGLTGLELGSDIGASIRNPAHYCGVYGHKPTYGVVPMTGQRAPGVRAPSDISVTGPMARSAEDLDLALGLMAGPEGAEARAWRLALPPPAKERLADFKVAAMLTDKMCVQDDELTARLQAAVDALAQAGVAVDEKARPAFDTADSHRVYLLLLRAQTTAAEPRETFERRLARVGQWAPEDRGYHAMVDRAATLYHRDWKALDEERRALADAWAAFFRDYDLLLCPTAASAAFPHDHAGERADRTIPVSGGLEPTVDQLFWAGLSGVVYLPSTVAPAGLSRSGLPCGLQIVAPYLGDRTAIAFAKAMAEAVGGFVPPPGYA